MAEMLKKKEEVDSQETRRQQGLGEEARTASGRKEKAQEEKDGDCVKAERQTPKEKTGEQCHQDFLGRPRFRRKTGRRCLDGKEGRIGSGMHEGENVETAKEAGQKERMGGEGKKKEKRKKRRLKTKGVGRPTVVLERGDEKGSGGEGFHRG